ncbi:MAG: hypothetical protein KGP29_07740 [Proteobacteria bacterium]|nr:hypothetical protein [Pseudomonadota bacterium]
MIIKNLNSFATKIISLGIILVFTSSCLGVSVIGEQVTEISLKDGCDYRLPIRSKSKSVIDLEFRPMSDVLKVGMVLGDDCDYLKLNKRRSTTVVRSPEDVLNFWGKPDGIKTVDGLEYWAYKRESAWSGIWINVGIPLVPLMLPVGTRNDVIVFRGNKIEKILTEDGTVRYFFGLVLGFAGRANIFDFYFGEMSSSKELL